MVQLLALAPLAAACSSGTSDAAAPPTTPSTAATEDQSPAPESTDDQSPTTASDENETPTTVVPTDGDGSDGASSDDPSLEDRASSASDGVLAEASGSTEPAPYELPYELKFSATLFGGDPFDGASLTGKDVLFWFWAPG